MKTIKKFDEIKDFIGKTKGINNSLITNIPIDKEKISKWTTNNQLIYFETGKSTLILRKSFDFHYLYYISTSIGALCNDLNKFTENFSSKIVIDIFGKIDHLNIIFNKLNQIGFDLLRAILNLRISELAKFHVQLAL